jgi:hypothetical protein
MPVEPRLRGQSMIYYIKYISVVAPMRAIMIAALD